MEKYGGSEKRKYQRANANFVVSYRLKDFPDSYDLSQTKNIGQGGLLLTTNKKFDKGTQLAMTIRFPFVNQRIEVTGEVMDSKEIVKGLIYETRIMFIDLPQDFFQQLGDFIKELLSKWSKK
ncbi:MAG: PilZ domain-containing protein [Candidatus Omnitrophota bacterium]|nr:PilZ domain-containing protein [Candidatus Omnitrophota bacterium]